MAFRPAASSWACWGVAAGGRPGGVAPCWPDWFPVKFNGICLSSYGPGTGPGQKSARHVRACRMALVSFMTENPERAERSRWVGDPRRAKAPISLDAPGSGCIRQDPRAGSGEIPRPSSGRSISSRQWTVAMRPPSKGPEGPIALRSARHSCRAGSQSRSPSSSSMQADHRADRPSGRNRGISARRCVPADPVPGCLPTEVTLRHPEPARSACPSGCLLDPAQEQAHGQSQCTMARNLSRMPGWLRPGTGVLMIMRAMPHASFSTSNRRQQPVVARERFSRQAVSSSS